MKRLEFLKNRIMELNFNKVEISKEIKPTLRLLGLFYEYWGNMSRANEYKRAAA